MYVVYTVKRLHICILCTLLPITSKLVAILIVILPAKNNFGPSIRMYVVLPVSFSPTEISNVIGVIVA
jgi:hypothetical protein